MSSKGYRGEEAEDEYERLDKYYLDIKRQIREFDRRRAKEIMLERKLELQEIEEFVRQHGVISRIGQTEHCCFSCESTLYRSHIKYMFEIARPGKKVTKRIYCDECAEDIPREQLRYMELIKVF